MGIARAAGVAGVFVLAFAGWLLLLDAERWRSDARAFDFASWEIEAAPGKWVHALGAPLRNDPPSREALERYFNATDRSSPDVRPLEGAVEASLEGRLDAVLQDLGFSRIGPLSVWPPVDLELTSAPRVLAESPRERIRLARAEPLRPELPEPALLALEREAESAPEGRSAIVLPLGGISTYPAIVTDRLGYRDTVEVAAHEWVHHYLAFHALGVRALFDREALTLSETVADLAGDEIAAQVLARYGDPTAVAGDATPSPASVAQLADRNATLRALRLEVDALLAEGRVEDAERRMEEVRRDLDARGIRIRRINQAYFAWYGTYAARPDSTDPVGAQLRELRGRAGSLPRFLELVRGVSTREGVAELLRTLRGE